LGETAATGGWNAEGASIPRCQTVRKSRAGNAGRKNSPTPKINITLLYSRISLNLNHTFVIDFILLFEYIQKD
jgi:hypothetical protein